MKDSPQAVVEAGPALSRPRAGPIACIELDRFCEGCGYNLRTLAVWRDVHMGIPVVRCPECGRYQSANDAATALRPWLHRTTSVLLWGWILTIIGVFFLLAFGEGAISYATLDELTAPEGYYSQRVGSTTTIIRYGGGPLQIKPDYEDYGLFVTSVLIASFAMAFSAGLLAAVVFPHWPRVAYAALALIVPAAANGLAVVGWSYDAPHLLIWGLQYVVAHAGVQMLGGLAGVTFGRPLARLAVRIIFPPSVRPRLAYLWLADGKPLPGP